LCFIGCGFIASQHARILKEASGAVREDNVRLSFASRDRAKAEAFRQTYGGVLAFGSYRDACAHEDVDAVVVSTPNADHHGTALLAISSRKHVIVDKPITITVAEADDILAAAAREGVRVLVAENHRYHPHIRWLERLLADGALGVVKMVRVHSIQRVSIPVGGWRAALPTMGGGVLIDGGVHWVNSLLTLGGGDASQVKAVESTRSLVRCPGEDTVVVTCRLENGAVGVLTYSWDIEPAFPDRFIAVHGEEGSAYVENRGRFGVTFIGKRLRPRFFPRRDREGFFAMWRDFLAELARGGESLATGLMGRRDLAFVEAAYRSLRSPDRYVAATGDRA
jgi:predicted dehydrogenase